MKVAIIGGGPAGSTCGTLIKKYNPAAQVSIFERERFPRDHVGESQLPTISRVLNEMGCWDKVERAGFPVKVGATYRWGRSDQLWDFEFLDSGKFENQPRPAKYAGQRLQTAFQVDRAIYDEILLDHAAEMGCEVRQETPVREVMQDGDRVTGLVLAGGETVEADYYVDATGHSGILRRAMGIETKSPTTLQNIAVWDYWQNAEWAVSVGVGGTRVLVLSQSYGWLWFIPLGPTRTSIGLVIPAKYYKESGKKPAELYEAAIQSDPLVSKLIRNATSEGKLSTTKDWSFLADRLVGENWFLAGESAGFADPILAAGLSLSHIGARQVAYLMLELERGEHDPVWLRERYDSSHRRDIGNHIRFGDFWYTHNGQFTDLQDCAKEIAGDMGLDLTAQQAWRWLGTGGFIDANTDSTGLAGYGFLAAKHITADFTGEERAEYTVAGKTHFRIDLEGSEKVWGADFDAGRITRHRVYRRNGKEIPNAGMCGWLIKVLRKERTFDELKREAAVYCQEKGIGTELFPRFRRNFMDHLEAMQNDGWLIARKEPDVASLPDWSLGVESFLHPNDTIL